MDRPQFRQIRESPSTIPLIKNDGSVQITTVLDGPGAPKRVPYGPLGPELIPSRFHATEKAKLFGSNMTAITQKAISISLATGILGSLGQIGIRDTHRLTELPSIAAIGALPLCNNSNRFQV